MTDILGRKLEPGQFVVFSRKSGSQQTLAVGLIIETYLKNYPTLGKSVWMLKVLGTEFNEHTETSRLGLQPFETAAHRTYITTDVPKDIKTNLRAARKIFGGEVRHA